MWRGSSRTRWTNPPDGARLRRAVVLLGDLPPRQRQRVNSPDEGHAESAEDAVSARPRRGAVDALALGFRDKALLCRGSLARNVVGALEVVLHRVNHSGMLLSALDRTDACSIPLRARDQHQLPACLGCLFGPRPKEAGCDR